MNRTADLTLEDFTRLPGLFRRWELTEVCAPNRCYQIEDAGRHADGTPLLAIYVGDPIPGPYAAGLGSVASLFSSSGIAG